MQSCKEVVKNEARGISAADRSDALRQRRERVEHLLVLDFAATVGKRKRQGEHASPKVHDDKRMRVWCVR